MAVDNRKLMEARELEAQGRLEEAAQIYDELGLHLIAEAVRKVAKDRSNEQ